MCIVYIYCCFFRNIVDESSTLLFVGEITESNLPKIPLCLGNSMELVNALRASAIRNSLKLPMTVTFLRCTTDIVSTSFFGGSSTAQIVSTQGASGTSGGSRLSAS